MNADTACPAGSFEVLSTPGSNTRTILLASFTIPITGSSVASVFCIFRRPDQTECECDNVHRLAAEGQANCRFLRTGKNITVPRNRRTPRERSAAFQNSSSEVVSCSEFLQHAVSLDFDISDLL